MLEQLEILQKVLSDMKAAVNHFFVFGEYRNKHGERNFYYSNGVLCWQRAQQRRAAWAIQSGGQNTRVYSKIFTIYETFVKNNT